MALKVKFRTQFPANVSVTAPLTMTKTGLSYTFGVDLSSLEGSLGTAAVANTGTSLHTIPFLDGVNTWSARQNILGTDSVGSGFRFYRANGTDYTEIFKSSAGIGGTSDSLNFYSSILSAIAISFGRDGSIVALAGILSVGPTSGIGYATGAGGAVTQATNKSTAVTLNKVSGQITTNNAALASVTTVFFTLTNSAIAATDTISINLKGGNATAATYSVRAEAIAAGSCIIVVKNDSGGSLSEALVLNFNVIKGVAS